MKLPPGWRRVRIGDLPIVLRGGTSVTCDDRPAGDSEDGILRLSAVVPGRFQPEENKAVRPESDSRLGPPVRANTVLITRSNTEDLVGLATFVDRDYPALHLPDLIWELSVPGDGEVHPRWLAIALSAPVVRKQIASSASGTSGSMKKLSMGRLRRVVLVVPPQAEQVEIAAMVERLDAGLDLMDRLLQQKERLKRGLMQQLLTGRQRFAQFAHQEWVDRQIGELFEEVSRPIEWDEAEHYDLLSIRRRSGGVFVRGRIAAKRIKTKTLFDVHSGDLLISKMQAVHGAIGLVGSAHDGMKVSGSYIVLRPKPRAVIGSSFFAYLTHLPQMYRSVLLSSYGVHIEKMTFNLKWYLRTPIRLPALLEEQDAIANCLSTIDREIVLLERLRALLSLERRAVADKLLSGELRMPGRNGVEAVSA